MLSNPGGLPGMSAKIESMESQIWWGHENLRIFAPKPIIAAASVDAGNTPTTTLRGGLIVAKRTADDLWYPYAPTQVDGRDVALGVLIKAVPMLNPNTGIVENKNGEILIGGNLKAAELVNLDGQARLQLSRQFILDDDIAQKYFATEFIREIPKTGDYTITGAFTGTEFTTEGAAGTVIFTLPAIAKGLAFKFYNHVDQTMTVTSAEGNNIVAFNDLAATSISFATAGNKIGAVAIVRANYAGTKWLVEIPCKHTLTVA